MDLAQLRRDAGLAREQLLKIVQEDTPFSYRKFSALGGKGLTARLDNLVPDDYIVIVNNKNKEDYYRLPYKSFLNLLDIYQDELEDRRNRGSSKIAQIKKRAQGNREKGKPDLFLQNDRLFGILDRTRDAVKLSQSKRQAETFTAEASKPVAPPPPPEPKKIEEGFSSINGTIYKTIIEDGISYLVDEDNNVYNDEYDEVGVWDGEDVEWNTNKAWKSHKRKMQALPEYDTRTPQQVIQQLRAEPSDTNPDDYATDNSLMYIKYEGIIYTIDNEFMVMDDESEEVGEWVVGRTKSTKGTIQELDPSGDIEFTMDGLARHLIDPKRGSTRDGIPKLVLPTNIPDWFSQASSPEPEPEEESDDEIRIEDFPDDDDDDEDDEDIPLRYEGVFYGIEPDMNVVDDDLDGVGKWVNGDIKFTRQGAKVHKSLRDTSADKIEWLSDKRPK